MELVPATLPGAIVLTITFVLPGVTAALFVIIRSVDDLLQKAVGAQVGTPGSIAYDGQQDTQTITCLEAFMHQARAYQAAKNRVAVPGEKGAR